MTTTTRPTTTPEDLARVLTRRRCEAGLLVRTSTCTAVITAHDDVLAQAAFDACLCDVTLWPGRTVLLRHADPDVRDLLVGLPHLHQAGDRWTDGVEVLAGGRWWADRRHLVATLALPDLPIVLWALDHVPDPDDPLLAMADRLVLLPERLAGHDLAAISRLRHDLVIGAPPAGTGSLLEPV